MVKNEGTVEECGFTTFGVTENYRFETVVVVFLVGWLGHVCGEG